MISGRVLLVAVLAIAVTFEQAVALQCRICNSKENADCLSSPDNIAPTTCELEAPETTTQDPVGTTTSGNGETTTGPPKGEETTTGPPKGEETTTGPPKGEETTTEPPKAEEKTTQAPKVEEKTTQASKAEEKTTQAPKTNKTMTQAPEVTKMTTAVPSTKTTKIAVAPVELAGNNKAPSLSNDVSNPEARLVELSEYPSVLNRLRRGVFPREDASSVCFKLVYKEGETDVVERGCAPKSDDPCAKLKEPAAKKDAGCYTCEKDGCNASSRISLGLTSIIVPAVIMMFLRL